MNDETAPTPSTGSPLRLAVPAPEDDSDRSILAALLLHDRRARRGLVDAMNDSLRWAIIIVCALWFFSDSVDYWLTRTEVHTVKERTVRL